MPEPSCFVVKNGMKMRSWTSLRMPGPLSQTWMVVLPRPSSLPTSRTFPPSRPSIAWTAFSRRLIDGYKHSRDVRARRERVTEKVIHESDRTEGH